MSITAHWASSSTVAAPPSKARDRVRKILLACGPLSALATSAGVSSQRCDGRAQPDLELHQRAAADRNPTKSLLDPWEGWVYSALSLAFGVGIWLSAQAAVRSAWSEHS